MLEPNWWTAQAYRQCEWTVHVGLMRKPVWQGIEAKEILAACMLVRAPRHEWSLIGENIKFVMVPAVQRYFASRST